MFTLRVTLKKLLAATLSVCLLGMSLGCVAVCAERLEDSAAADAHDLSEPCDDGDCLVKSSVASALPERSFLSPGFDDSVSQHPPVPSVIGIGRDLTAPPSHTTVHTVPYTAVRTVMLFSCQIISEVRLRRSRHLIEQCSAPGSC